MRLSYRLYSDNDLMIVISDFPEILMSSVQLYSVFLSDKATHRIGPVSESCMLHKNSPRLDPETRATNFFYLTAPPSALSGSTLQTSATVWNSPPSPRASGLSHPSCREEIAVRNRIVFGCFWVNCLGAQGFTKNDPIPSYSCKKEDDTKHHHNALLVNWMLA